MQVSIAVYKYDNGMCLYSAFSICICSDALKGENGRQHVKMAIAVAIRKSMSVVDIP